MNTHQELPLKVRRYKQRVASLYKTRKELVSLGANEQELDRAPVFLQSAKTGVLAKAYKRHGSAKKRVHSGATGGLAAAVRRGEAARVQWVTDGLVMAGEDLAAVWGLTRQALVAAAQRNTLVAVKINNRLYYPRAFEGLNRDDIAVVCRALGAISASEKMMFWLRNHGSLAGKSAPEALNAGVPVQKLERLAHAWARERGALDVASAA